MVEPKGQNNEISDSPKGERESLRRLSYARLVVTSSLVLATWWWRSSFSEVSSQSGQTLLGFLYAISFSFSVLSLSATQSRISFHNQARIQLFGDVLLITFLVALTGGASAPSATLYIMIVAASGYFLKKEETILVSVTAAAAFILVVFLDKWDQVISTGGLGADSSQTLALTVAGILIVGLLAGRVADRRKIGDTLRETVESLDKLKLLHERIVESVQMGLLVTDLDGVIYDSNQAASLLADLQGAGLSGRSLTEVFGDDAAKALLRMNGSLIPGDAEESFECNLLNGSSTVVRCRIYRLIGTNGSATGYVVSFEDLTEIRRMESSMKKTDRLAAVGRMAAGLAHEIRNPLGSMGSALQFLRERDHLDDADRELLDMALKESARLEEIIRNFLTYAKPGTAVFGKDGNATVDLSSLLRDSATLLKHSPEIQDNHLIDLELPERSTVIRGNEVRIKQVFWNIARNAVAAMPEGGSLIIRVEQSESGETETILFKDTGIGIPRDRLDRLFEPFSDDAHGIGLGLSIVRRIVTEHQGTITINSKEGIGTEVRVTFPVVAKQQ
jgi:two-component system, NtrC family, sensor histidine kinase PilS